MKLYASIIGMLATFFGLGADASESEVHQALADAGTLDQIKDKAKADAKAEFESVVNDLNAKITANTEAVDGVKAEVESLKAELKTAQDALAQKQRDLEAAEAKVTELSTELANLKVEKASTKTTEKVDEGLKTENQKTNNSNAKVISNEAFMAMFN